MKRKLRILASSTIVVAALHGAARAQQACQSTGDLSCDVYTSCIEAKCDCAATSSNYVATFGPKYCRRFGNEDRFSNIGIEWRRKTLLCLKDAVSRSYVANSDATGRDCNCAQIQQDAVDSHSTCYLSQPSFCKLTADDIRTIARIVDSPDMMALGAGGIAEMGVVLATCFWEEGIDKGNMITRTFIEETIAENKELAKEMAIEVMNAAIAYSIERAKAGAESALRRLFDELLPTEIPRY